MADKLSSQSILKLRNTLKGEVGTEQATTMTARVARKVEKKNLKRNKISMTVKPLMHSDIATPDEYFATIKKGGVPRALARITYDPGDPHISPDEFPARIIAGGIIPASKLPPFIDSAPIVRHAAYSRKVLSPSDVRRSLVALKKRFPAAKTVEGLRASGMRNALLERAMEGGVPNFNVEADGPTIVTQRIKLPNLAEPPTLFDKAMTRKNSARLRGASKGVINYTGVKDSYFHAIERFRKFNPHGAAQAAFLHSRRKLQGAGGGLAAPLEAAVTAGLSGGGVTGAATAAATTAASQTAIGAGIKRAMALASKIPISPTSLLGRMASRAVPAAMIGSGAVDVGRIVHHGYQAYKAGAEAKVNEASMKEKYGSVEAATRTRHARKKGV